MAAFGEEAREILGADATEKLINRWVLTSLDEVWREKINEYGLALDWPVTEEAIPIIEECLEKKDPAALEQWEQAQMDQMKDGEDW